MIHRFTKHIGLALAIVGLTTGSMAGAETLKYAFGYPAASTVGLAAEEYAASVKERSGGTVSVRNFPLSLLSLAEAGPGLRDGLADIAYVVTALSPGDYPRYMLMQDVQLVVNLRKPTGKESLAYAGAVIEYTMKCPECLADFARQGQVYMGGATSSINMALCTKPIQKLEDLRGMKIRVSHAVVSRMFADLGATPVSFPANESYEALSQGVVDCSQLSLPELTNMSLADVVKSVTIDLPGGLSSNVAVGNINRDSWQALDKDQRAALVWGASQLSSDITWGYYADALNNQKVADDHKIGLINVDAAVLDKMRAFAEADLPSTIASYRIHYGVQEADEIAEGFLAAYEEWLKLVEPIESRDALRDLFWTRIFKDIDPAAYSL
ncbi:MULTISPECIES: TRAP transporter substrate-binding protein DctP [unclassified Haematobacter]|uniref:TRAP transporter substrate-binding protein DctP n=1 Tax=unclassified Haematobacter TaxID=2640585 RepID=UPI0025C5928D|nr:MULTISPECIES: TRAP transporter substrate-binding protein DctP [unclassified Haematobacter]